MEAFFLIGFLWLGYRELKRYGSKFYGFQLEKHNATKDLIKSANKTVETHEELIATQKSLIDALDGRNDYAPSKASSKASSKAADEAPGKVYTHLKNSKSIKRVNPTQAHH